MIPIDEQIAKVIIWFLYIVGLYFSLFWLYSLIFDEKKYVRKKISKWPGVTVIIPCYNEEKTIEKTLECVFNLDYPKEKLKVICVNDGSKDNTLKILKKLKKKYNFTLIDQENQGKYMALNNALKIVKTKYFSCLDADSYVEKDSLKKLIEEFDSKEVVAVMPVMKVHNPQNIIQRVQWFEYILNIFYKYIMGKLDCIHVTPGPFSTYRTEVVKKLGGFRKGHLTEDLEMALRLQDNHYRLKQSVTAVVHTNSPNNLKSFINQRTRWYQGTLLNVKDYKHFLFNRKYGDFGFFQMPLVAITGILTLIGVLVVVYLFLKGIYFNIKRMYLTNFDFATYLKDLRFNFSILDLDWQVLFTSFFLFFILFNVIFLAFNYVNERTSIFKNFKYFLMFLYYLFVYKFIMALIWFRVLKRIIFNKDTKWLK